MNRADPLKMGREKNAYTQLRTENLAFLNFKQYIWDAFLHITLFSVIAHIVLQIFMVLHDT